MKLVLLILLTVGVASSSTRRRPSTHQSAYPIAIQLFSSKIDLAKTIAQRCKVTIVSDNIGNQRTFLFFDPRKKNQNDIGTFKCLEGFFEVEWFAEQGPKDMSRNFYQLYPNGEFKRWLAGVEKDSLYQKIQEFRRELYHSTITIRDSFVYIAATIGGLLLSLFGL